MSRIDYTEKITDEALKWDQKITFDSSLEANTYCLKI